MKKLSREFLLAIPKTDLHVHLDGSLRLGSLIELAREQKVELPSQTEEGLKELVFKSKYQNLPEYLHGFKYTVQCLQTPEALERASYELALDNFAEGVCYIEPRFAPQLHSRPGFSIEDVLASVNKGLSRAQQEINARPEVKSGEKVPFEYGIIGCAMRMFTAGFSPYFKSLFELHPLVPAPEIFSLASLDVVRALVKARDELGIPVVGFDLAGAEKGYPSEDHRAAYSFAHKHFLKKTVHAGEAYGPSSIFQAITDCFADRIGHGTNLFDHTAVPLDNELARKKYVAGLAKYIADQRITIELCLTSNMQTIPELSNLKDHPLRQMLKEKLSVTFCTDNRLVSHTTVTDEIEKAVEAFGISAHHLRHTIIYGFKRSFFAKSYPEKRAYVRKVINVYEAIEKRFAIDSSATAE